MYNWAYAEYRLISQGQRPFVIIQKWFAKTPSNKIQFPCKFEQIFCCWVIMTATIVVGIVPSVYLRIYFYLYLQCFRSDKRSEFTNSHDNVGDYGSNNQVGDNNYRFYRSYYGNWNPDGITKVTRHHGTRNVGVNTGSVSQNYMIKVLVVIFQKLRIWRFSEYHGFDSQTANFDDNSTLDNFVLNN